MKITSLLAAMILAASALLSGCESNDGPVEKAGENIDNAIDDAGDKIEDAGDKIEDKMKH